MDVSQYTAATLSTAVYPEAGGQTERELNYLIHGLTGEAGELSNAFKKLIRNNLVTLTRAKGLVLPFDQRDKLIDELGDVMWYAARIAHTLDLSLEEVMQRNVEKLQKRKAADQLKNHPQEVDHHPV